MNKTQTILLAGGGSGGHLTPLISVAEAIKRQDDSVNVVHVGQKNENLNDVLENSKIDAHYAISAGKFRRYHGESFSSHLLDFKTIFLNIRDFFRFAIGTVQAWFLLGKIKPDSIMLKGGFVCVPVGIAARFRNIPYITHDSDAIPGLANRITASNAVYNTTALPAEIYPYDQSKTVQVGIPLRPEFKKITDKDREKAKKSLGLENTQRVLLVAGGGLGSQTLNMAVASASKTLISGDNDMVIVHLTGKKLYKETEKAYLAAITSAEFEKVILIDFTTEPALYAQASDLVITRGGATNIAEFATLGLPCVVIPNPVLTGGQQLHNAKVLSENNAAVILDESNLAELASVVSDLFDKSSKEKRDVLATKLHTLVSENADEKLATLLIEIAAGSDSEG